MQSKISVIIPTYNRAHIILDALKSVTSQTYSNWECLIIDDRSTDNSEEVIKSFIENDQRFIFFKRPKQRPKGAASCRNLGLENMTGDFVQFLDSDDSIAENKFEIQLRVLLNSEGASISTCRFAIQRPSWKNPEIYAQLPTYKNFKNPVNLFTCFAKNFTYFPPNIYLTPRLVVQKAGKWKENLRVNDDGEFFSRVILNSSRVLFCKETHAIYKTGAKDRITGELTQPSGVKSFVHSWISTNQNIYERTGISNHIYVQSAKRNLQRRLLKENPSLIPKYQYFLKGKWNYFSYILSLFVHKFKYRMLSLKSFKIRII